jgi:hypothetical protein
MVVKTGLLRKFGLKACCVVIELTIANLPGLYFNLKY